MSLASAGNGKVWPERSLPGACSSLGWTQGSSACPWCLMLFSLLPLLSCSLMCCSFKHWMWGIRLDAVHPDGPRVWKRVGVCPASVYTCHFVSSQVFLRTKIGKQRGRAGWVLWAVDLGVKYSFGLDGTYTRGHCVGDGHSTSPASDPLANMDIDPHVRRSRIPLCSTQWMGR